MGYLGIFGAGRRFFWRNLRSRSGRRVRPEGGGGVVAGNDQSDAVALPRPSPDLNGDNSEGRVPGEIGDQEIEEIEPVVDGPYHILTLPLLSRDLGLWKHLQRAKGDRPGVLGEERVSDEVWDSRGNRYKSFMHLVGTLIINDSIDLDAFDTALRNTGFYPPLEQGSNGYLIAENPSTVMEYGGNARVVPLGDLKACKMIMATAAACLLRYSVSGVPEKPVDLQGFKQHRYRSLKTVLLSHDLWDTTCTVEEFKRGVKATGFAFDVFMENQLPKLRYENAGELMFHAMGLVPDVNIDSPILICSTSLLENKKLILAAVSCNIEYTVVPQFLNLFTD